MIKNPYLDLLESNFFQDPHFGGYDYMRVINQDVEFAQLNGERLFRDDLTNRFAWAIPSQAAIELIAKYGPIVEIGAGTGYWAWLLRQAGVDVVAYDQAPVGSAVDNHWHPAARAEKSYSEVLVGGPESAARHPDRALMLCWPPYSDQMAADCLDSYAGDTVIFIGEDEGGCTADDDFFAALYTEWEEIDGLMIPQWSGLHDRLFIYRRKSTTHPKCVCKPAVLISHLSPTGVANSATSCPLGSCPSANEV